MNFRQFLEAYDTSEKNREHYDSFTEWKKAVIQAGGEVTGKLPEFKAHAWDGECGEFNTQTDQGWLVAKWSKKT